MTWTLAANQPIGPTPITVLVSDNQAPPDVVSETFTVDVSPAPITPTITWTTPSDIVYGTALGATQLDATGSVPGSFTYTPPAGTVLNVGQGQTLTANFTPNDTTDYTTASGSVKINVTQATPDVSVNPLSLNVGTPLANSQLSGTATWVVGGVQVNVPGTYTYTSAAGTELGVGNGQTESVTFTPQDSTDYSTVTTSVTIDVAQGVVAVSVNPVNLTYGTALANSQLGGTATATVGGSPVNVPGTFTYTSAAGKVLGAGNNLTESVTFTPQDATDYAPVNTTVVVNVAQATPDVSVNPLSIPVGVSRAAGQQPAQRHRDLGGRRRSGQPPGYVHLHQRRGHGPRRREWADRIGDLHTCKDTTDYSSCHDQRDDRRDPGCGVGERQPGESDLRHARQPNSQLGGTATATVGGSPVNVTGTYTYTSAAGKVLGAGNNQTESVTFTPQNTAEYSPVTTNVTINVAQATPVVSVNPVNLAYGTALGQQRSSTARPRR